MIQDLYFGLRLLVSLKFSASSSFDLRLLGIAVNLRRKEFKKNSDSLANRRKSILDIETTIQNNLAYETDLLLH